MSAAEPSVPPGGLRGAARDDAFSSPPVNVAAAAKLPVRDLLAAYALLRGQKIAFPHVTLLREAFPGLFRSRPRWSAGAWDACDEACLDAIRTLLRQRGRLHLVAALEQDEPAP
jgi:hypothetical protein